MSVDTVATLVPMAKKQESTSVKLNLDVWKMAKVICTANDESMQDYLSDLLRPLLQKDYPAALAKLQKLGADIEPDKPKGGRK